MVTKYRIELGDAQSANGDDDTVMIIVKDNPFTKIIF